ncbi:HNH endonuclease [Acinetobacter sp. YH12096]|uniref:HNH endonuclease n=1 Tax=Acinetobacter sp. YH12096 TaxID=2601085 RepID=UPI0015D0D12E|nr:HNH endonuclease [Acinetobacter sp. YH12096]
MLNADSILNHLLVNYSMEQWPTPINKVYRLHHPKIHPYLHINRKVQTKQLAVSLRYDTFKEEIKQIEGVICGTVSHHANYIAYSKPENIGESSYIPTKQQETPAAQHYGFENTKALDRFMEVCFDLKPTMKVISEDFSVPLIPTEKDALIKARIGQSTYRNALCDYWNGCAVTGCTLNDLLIASHIKPWSASNNKERLDQFNGLLLSPTLDKAFDKGLISFDAAGSIMISPKLSKDTLDQLGISPNMKLSKIDPRHNAYLQWHRNNLFNR